MNKILPILDKSAAALSQVAGIQAIVLGGSRARGTHTPSSDIDIGIYYNAASLDLAALEQAAQSADDEHRNNLITPPGGWGQWVNGGGWLMIDNYHVDFLLRDIERVEKVIAESQEGIVTAHYQTGHPHAYLNTMDMGEVAVCKMLWESGGHLSTLKHTAEQYPAKLKKAIIDFFSFEAGFSLVFAQNSSEKDDIYYVTAHIVRSVSAINQVLFALNEEYCLNEEKDVSMKNSIAIRPDEYKRRIDNVCAVVGVENQEA